MKLDSNFIRSQFPVFKEPSLDEWAYFENAGGSYTCQQVIDRLMDYYTKTKVQPCYLFKASLEADVRMNESYTQLAGYLNVSEDEINFGPSTTQNIYVLAYALKPLWENGGEIIVSNQDHEANAGSWRKLASTGIIVKEWTVDSETGKLDLDELQGLITDRTKLIWLNYPNMPTGKQANLKLLEKVIALDKAHNIFVCNLLTLENDKSSAHSQRAHMLITIEKTGYYNQIKYFPKML